MFSHSVMSDSLWPHGLQPARLLCPWDSPFSRQYTGVGCHALLQGIFLTPGSNPSLPHCRWILYHLSHQGSPFLILMYIIIIVTLIAILIYNFNLINIWILILKLSSYFCIFYIFLLQIAFVCSTFSSTFLKLGIWRHTVCVISFIHPTPQCDFFK